MKPPVPRMVSRILLSTLIGMLAVPAATVPVRAQEQSVKPGINKQYENPDAEKIAKSYEREGREAVQKLDGIVAACELRPGMAVADVGAGTGLFTRPFARAVAPGGKVFAVDITEEFVDWIEKTCREQEIENVTCVKNTETSVELPPESVDLVFLCDTYHHFEYPFKMLDSISAALKPGGRLVIVDYKREEGVSREWVMGHVRAGMKTVIAECERAGFTFVDEVPGLMKENYLIRLEKRASR